MKGSSPPPCASSWWGSGRFPGTDVTLEARYRFAPSWYAVASGGTVFFPQPDGSLVRGVDAGLGLGADFGI